MTDHTEAMETLQRGLAEVIPKFAELVGVDYRAIVIHICDDENTLSSIVIDPDLIEPVQVADWLTEASTEIILDLRNGTGAAANFKPRLPPPVDRGF